jgi:hypothetical protein
MLEVSPPGSILPVATQAVGFTSEQEVVSRKTESVYSLLFLLRLG